ncbi:hypothetical protein L0F63_006804, partial [Massospora cicadina]
MSTEKAKFKGYACMRKGTPLEEFSYVPRPLGERDVEIKIDFCGICGSDIHCIDCDWGEANYPTLPGHEIVGRITGLGAKVKEFKLGDLVGVGSQCGACLKQDCEACSSQNDIHCPFVAETYESKWPDGEKTYGGYADKIRVQCDYTFHVPTNMPPECVAPLMCAGVTVFTPMRRQGIKAGDRVGVVGIGGLGHLAIMFAKALGANVTALSTSENKREDAMKMGADRFVNTEKESINNEFDYLFITTSANDVQYAKFIEWMRIFGKLIVLALPKSDLKVNTMGLVCKSLSIVASLTGSKHDVKEMLKFAEVHNIRPWVQCEPMANVNQCIQEFRSRKTRYR